MAVRLFGFLFFIGGLSVTPPNLRGSDDTCTFMLPNLQTSTVVLNYASKTSDWTNTWSADQWLLHPLGLCPAEYGIVGSMGVPTDAYENVILYNPVLQREDAYVEGSMITEMDGPDNGIGFVLRYSSVSSFYTCFVTESKNPECSSVSSGAFITIAKYTDQSCVRGVSNRLNRTVGVQYPVRKYIPMYFSIVDGLLTCGFDSNGDGQITAADTSITYKDPNPLPWQNTKMGLYSFGYNGCIDFVSGVTCTPGSSKTSTSNPTTRSPTTDTNSPTDDLGTDAIQSPGSSSSTPPNAIAAIAGGVVGGGFLIIAIAAVIAFILIRRRRANSSPHLENAIALQLDPPKSPSTHASIQQSSRIGSQAVYNNTALNASSSPSPMAFPSPIAFPKKHASHMPSPMSSPSSSSSPMPIHRSGKTKTAIRSDEIVFIEEVGKGGYGIVWKAKWRAQLVAVKQLKKMDQAAQEEFARESDLMSELPPHQNVVSFIGVTMDDPICIVTEFLEGGSVSTFLSENPGVMTFDRKLSILRNCSAGMLHLSICKIVHKDLAARNLLMTVELEAKICDFGMSRISTSSQNNTVVSQAEIGPIKWMAFESLKDKIYSTKSDVYSFGITAIEILTEQEF